MGEMTSSGREHPNIRYWRAGAGAFANLGLGLPNYYICPLCFHGFTEDQALLLTREHVPTRALGGRRLVLTCPICNSTAGHAMDSHAAEFERVQDFSWRKPGNSYPIRYQAEGGIDVNAEAEWSADGSLSIAGVPESNAPGALCHLNAELTRRWREGKGLPDSQISVRFRHRVSLRRASVSWLRAAYLAAFAALGYRYVFRKELNLVREQILQPETSVIKGFRQEAPGAAASGRVIFFINQPQWARGLTVQIGACLVLLPYLENATDYYDRLGREVRDGSNVTFKGKAIPWPDHAEFRLDHAPPSERALYAKLVSG